MKDNGYKVSAFERALAYCVGEEKAAETTDRLLSSYGSASTLFSARSEELCYVGDLNRNAVLLVKLMAYINARRVTDAFTFGEEHTELELRDYIAALFLGASVEEVYAILLDESNRVIFTEHISEGTVNASDVVPRKILECLRRRGARRVILAHNHPKGNAEASGDDLSVTGKLHTLFASVGVRLVAHYIVADGDVVRIDTDELTDPC